MSGTESQRPPSLSVPELDAPPLPLERLISLLPDDGELDGRWGARRQGERIPFCKPVAIRRVEGQLEVAAIFEGWSLNVAHGGMRIITEEPLRVGDLIQVEVTSAGKNYLGRACVAWVRAEADGVVAGLKFELEADQHDGDAP
jgi:hypothetical protein